MEMPTYGQSKLGVNMKYKLNGITSVNSLNDWQGLGKDKAELLNKGNAVELTDPPKHLVDGGYLVESKEVKKQYSFIW